MTVRLAELSAFLDKTLEIHKFQDYCPNGLQVDGPDFIETIVTGVTASQALIDAAIDLQADAILVHHGWFWKGEDSRIIGIKRKRLQTLLEHNIALLAYHLPLDAHPVVGNNAQLAKRMGWSITDLLEPNNPKSVGNVGILPQAMTAAELSVHIQAQLERSPMLIESGPAFIQKIAWCTGAAQSYIDKAIALGVDAFISGEISEPTVHAAREAGIHYFACGHHATERYGVKALGELVAQEMGIAVSFVDIHNPV